VEGAGLNKKALQQMDESAIRLFTRLLGKL
jgi:hypothetical protein